VALRTLPEGGEILRRKGEGWERILAYGQADSLTTQPIDIEGDGKSALMLSSVGRDKAALLRVNLADGSTAVLGESSQADVQGVWLDPRSRTRRLLGQLPAQHLRTARTRGREGHRGAVEGAERRFHGREPHARRLALDRRDGRPPARHLEPPL